MIKSKLATILTLSIPLIMAGCVHETEKIPPIYSFISGSTGSYHFNFRDTNEINYYPLKKCENYYKNLEKDKENNQKKD